MNLKSSSPGRTRQSERGTAVIVMLALLAIMALLVAANSRTVYWLRNEVKLVDQRQTARLAASVTNEITSPATTPPATP